MLKHIGDIEFKEKLGLGEMWIQKGSFRLKKKKKKNIWLGWEGETLHGRQKCFKLCPNLRGSGHVMSHGCRPHPKPSTETARGL